MEQVLPFVAVALLVLGLIGQGFEMRKIRLSTMKDEDLSSKNIFLHKRNLKWYVLIAVGLLIWALSSYLSRGSI
ncbi:MAG: hypothetical protein WDZ43_05875 [Nitrosopumilaceae archaeon]